MRSGHKLMYTQLSRDDIKPEGDRATEFKAVDGPLEASSGSVLLISAYAFIWAALLLWLVVLWRGQNKIRARINRLDHKLDEYEAKMSKRSES